MIFSNTIVHFFFQNWFYNPGSGSKFNVFGSTTFDVRRLSIKHDLPPAVTGTGINELENAQNRKTKNLPDGPYNRILIYFSHTMHITGDRERRLPPKVVTWTSTAPQRGRLGPENLPRKPRALSEVPKLKIFQFFGDADPDPRIRICIIEVRTGRYGSGSRTVFVMINVQEHLFKWMK